MVSVVKNTLVEQEVKSVEYLHVCLVDFLKHVHGVGVDREVVGHDGEEAVHADGAAVGSHVHSDHFYTKVLGQQLGEVCFTGTGRPGEHDAGDRLFVGSPSAIADAR